MQKNRVREPEAEPNADAAQPRSGDRCLVCGREANGRAICADPNCAAELAFS